MSIQDSFVGDESDKVFYSQVFFNQMATRNPLMAEVVIPDPEDLRVNLVRSDLLDRLDEYRHNQNIWSAGVGLFGGAVLGIIVNGATGGTMTPSAWILIIAFSLVAGLFAYFFHRDSQHGESTKSKILNAGGNQQQTP